MLYEGNGVRGWLLAFHKYATRQNTDVVTESPDSESARVKTGGINFDVVCILMHSIHRTPAYLSQKNTCRFFKPKLNLKVIPE